MSRNHPFFTAVSPILLSRMLGGIIFLAGCLVEIGWWTNSVVLKSIVPGVVAMNPHTALAFILAGVSIVVLSAPRRYRGIILLSGFVTFLFGIVRMIGIFGGPDLHLDQVLFHRKLLLVEGFAKNRIAPNTALNLMLLGGSLMLATYRRGIKAIQGACFLTFFIALLAILGYAYAVQDLYGFLSYTPMALNTAICFLISSLALLLVLPKVGITALIASTGVGGFLIRRMTPSIIFIPAILGLLTILAENRGIYGYQYGTSLLVVFVIMTFIIILGVVVLQTNTLDERRRLAEAEIQKAKDDIERTNKALDEKLLETKGQNNKLEETKRAMLNILEDLEGEKAKDEALLGSIGDAVFAVDHDGRIVLFNPVAEEVSGWSREEALGKPWNEVLHFVYEDSGKENHDFVDKALSGEKSEMANHTMIVRKDGTKLSVGDSASPVRNLKGDVTGAVIVFRDVTREREVDRAKTEFVSLASHQLRTPLTAIGWYAELLGGSKLTKAQKEYLAEITDGNRRMVELVNSLLNVSRIDLGTLASSPRDVDIAKLCRDIVTQYALTSGEKKQNVTVTISPEPFSYLADPALLRIVFENLVSNAIKYTPEKGDVRIHLENKNGMQFDVSDTGYGIPADEQSKIFTKLYRADNAREKVTDGNGLGLYLVRSIVEQHGGKIWFESTENKGTTFHVTLPEGGMKTIEGAKTLAK